MDNLDFINKLMLDTMEVLRDKNGDLRAGVDFVIESSKQNSISPEILFSLAKICASEKMYREEYIFSRACGS